MRDAPKKKIKNPTYGPSGGVIEVSKENLFEGHYSIVDSLLMMEDTMQNFGGKTLINLQSSRPTKKL